MQREWRPAVGVRRAGGARRPDVERPTARWPVDTTARDVVGEIMARDALQDHVDVLMNKLAAIIANAELLTLTVEGEAAGRADGLLRSARSAAVVVSSLQGCLR